MTYSSTIRLCKFCGEKGTGILCPSCKTKEQRKEKILQQLEIEKGFKAKGYKIPSRLFMFNREQLLETYEIVE